MNYKALIGAAGLLVAAGSSLTGQQPAAPAIFKAAQAEAGRATYDNTCGK